MSTSGHTRFGAIVLLGLLTATLGAARADICSDGFSGEVVSVSSTEIQSGSPGGWVVAGVACHHIDGEAPSALPPRGGKLMPGTRIAVNPSDQLSLFDGHSGVEVVPGSTVAIGKAGEADLELISGTIWVTPVKDQTAIKVGAPHLVATAENAKIAVSTQSNDVSAVAVGSGQVTVTNTATGETKTVPAGSTAFVSHETIDIKPDLVTEAPKAAKPAPVWILKAVTLQGDGTLDPAKTPKPGTGVRSGTRISTETAGDTNLTIELVNVNGRDRIVIRPGSIVTIGDNDPKTERHDLSILKGAVEVEASTPSISVYAPHLLATIANARGVVSAQSTISAVSVEDGSVEVASLLTGVKRDVPVGVTQVVRSKQTPPLTFPPEMGVVEQMQ